MKVLLVDDSTLVRERLTSMLVDLADVEVVEQAQNLDEALRIMRAFTPDVVIVDIHMPKDNGFDVLRAVKRAQPAPTVIMLTNYASPQYRDRCFKEGADFFLDKSLEFEKVYDLIRGLQHGSPCAGCRLAATQRAQAETANHYRRLFESIPLGLYRSTPEGQILDANPALVQILGYPDKETLLAINAVELHLTPDARQQLQAWLQQEGVVRDLELQLRHYQGARIWARVHIQTVRDAAGQALYYEGIVEDITARKQAENALRESEGRYRSFFMNAREGVFCSTPQGRFLEVNPALVHMLGYESVEEVLALQLSDDLYVDPAQRRHITAEAESQGFTEGVEVRWKKKGGESIEVSLYAQVVRDAHNNAVAYEGIALDITARKRAEEALQESNTLLQGLFEAAPDAIVLTDGHGKILQVNAQTEEIFGYTRAELLGSPIEILVPESFREKHVQHRARYVTEPHIRPMSVKLNLYGRRKDGSTFPVDISLGPLVTNRGLVVLSLIHNITARKQAEEALQQESQVTAALAKVGRELIASFETSTVLTRLCQLTVEVLDCDCVHTVLWEPNQNAYIPVANAGDTSEQWETLRIARVPREAVSALLSQFEQEDAIQVVTAEHPDLLPAVFLKQVDVTVALWIALRKGKEVIGALSAGYRARTKRFTPTQKRIAHGLSHLASLALTSAKLFEELTQANQLKEDFLATMSHELRTPFNIIMGYTELLLEGAFGSLTEEQCAPLHQVHKSAEDLLEILTATLEASQLAAGKMSAQMAVVNVTEFLENCKEEATRWCEQAKLHLHWQVAADLPPVHTDPTKLKIVVRNLLNNAVKFTKEGSVTVAARPRAGGLEIKVSDTGIGIAPEILPTIFDLFLQGDRSTTRHYGGIGVGLYIVRQMLNLLGGKIEVESEPGKGSTFCVWLPNG